MNCATGSCMVLYVCLFFSYYVFLNVQRRFELVFSNLRAWHFQFLIKGTSCACCMRRLSVLVKSQTAVAATLASVSLESLLCGAVFVAYNAIKCRRNRRRLRGASNTMAFIAQIHRVVAVSSVWIFRLDAICCVDWEETESKNRVVWQRLWVFTHIAASTRAKSIRADYSVHDFGSIPSADMAESSILACMVTLGRDAPLWNAADIAGRSE